MKSIIKAVFTITLFTFIDRVLGFFFKIYLSRTMGAETLGIYQVALSLFFVLITFTTSGIPLIVSKLTAKYRVEKKIVEQHKIATAALVLENIISIAICLFILLCAKPISGFFQSSDSLVALLFMLPAVYFSGVYSAFRGNLWGHERYTVVSSLEVVEQIIKMGVCFVLFALGFNKLKMTALSMSIACGANALISAVIYFCTKGKLSSPKGYILPLIKSSTPITFVRASNTVSNSVVALLVPFLLVTSGFSKADALSVFGSSVGMAFPLLYLPITVIGALSYVLIPTLSASRTENNTSSIKQQIESAITFSIFVALLFLPLYISLGKPLCSIMYKDTVSGEFLSYSAFLLLPLSVESITSSMMNSLDLEKSSFFNYLIGAAVMFIIMLCFIKNFSINILSLAMGVSLTLSCILDIIAIKKKTGIQMKFMFTMFFTLLLCVPATFLIKWTYVILPLPDILKLFISGILGFCFMLGLTFALNVMKIDIFIKRKHKKPRNA